MPRECSEPGCKKPVRGRGLCKTHYSAKWKTADLPQKERKELLVRHKLYLTREQTLRSKEIAAKNGKPVSGFLRDVVAKFLEAFDEAEAAARES